MKTKSILVVLCCGTLAAVLSGCLSTDNRAAVRAHIAGALKVAYDAGGASLVATCVDALVAEGKLTAEQAAVLKSAAQNGYNAIQTHLSELPDCADCSEQ